MCVCECACVCVHHMCNTLHTTCFRCPLTPLCARVRACVFAHVCARTHAHTHMCAKALTEQELEFRSRVLQARSALVLPDLVYGLFSLAISCTTSISGSL